MSKRTFIIVGRGLLSAAAALWIAGCQSNNTQTVGGESAPAQSAGAGGRAAPVANGVVRINAGALSPFKDSSGNIWAADQGFSGGDTTRRPDVNVTNAADMGIYRSEHYGMESFSWPLANGKYLVKLHFAETYEGVEGPGQRTFSFNVQGHEFKDFDVWVKAGGRFKAYVESVPVEIANGKLLITFTSTSENPLINGIEILPRR